MTFLYAKNYEELSQKAAEIFIGEINKKPDMNLGLATGSTPIGLYQNLIKAYQDKKISFRDITTFNLDEYYPIAPGNDQSYIYFMKTQLFDHIDLNAGNIHIPNGQAPDAAAECEQYDAKIEAAGNIDLQLLGVGPNGHIAFNEPGEELFSGTHQTGLTEATIKANSRFFASEQDVPKTALTMGMAPIFKAKKVVVLLAGNGKKAVYEKLLTKKITTACPVTLLHMHPDCTVVIDESSVK